MCIRDRYYCIQCDDEEWTESWMRNGGRPTAQRFLELDDVEQDAILCLIADSYVAIPDLNVEGKHYYLVHAYPCLLYTSRTCCSGWSLRWRRFLHR